MLGLEVANRTQPPERIPARSVLPPTTDMRRLRQHFRLVPKTEMTVLVGWTCDKSFCSFGKSCFAEAVDEQFSVQQTKAGHKFRNAEIGLKF